MLSTKKLLLCAIATLVMSGQAWGMEKSNEKNNTTTQLKQHDVLPWWLTYIVFPVVTGVTIKALDSTTHVAHSLICWYLHDHNLSDAHLYADCLKKASTEPVFMALTTKLKQVAPHIKVKGAQDTATLQEICLKINSCEFKDEQLSQEYEHLFCDRVTEKKLPEDYKRIEQETLKKQVDSLKKQVQAQKH